jgi:lysophospholipase L1-like esterase
MIKFKQILIIIHCLILTIGSGLLASEVDSFNKSFSHKGIQYLLSIEQSIGMGGCDIFLTGDTARKNLSLHFMGENLFPNVRIHGDHFYVTWILARNQYNHQQQRYQQHVYPCYYDSYSDTSHIIPWDGFRFLSNPYLVFRGSHPRALVFLGRRFDNDNGDNNNDEVFAYHLAAHRLINITRTPENEKSFSVIEEHGGFSIRAETIPFDAFYTVRFPGLDVIDGEKYEKEVVVPGVPKTITAAAYNTIVGFGDSITYGKMRMYDLPGEYHPELAYLSLIQDTLTENYGLVNTINLGIPADSTSKAMARLHNDFTDIEAYFCLIMLGTCDVGSNQYSPDSSEENLRWICLQIRDTYGMVPIISTIPPMNHILGGQFFKTNTENLNERIKEMAEELNIPCVDTYAAFFDQPDWESLLEDIVEGYEVGVHPSPAGHEVIANLFLPEILALPPQMPSDIQGYTINPYRLTIEWSENVEFDFSHYVIEFAFNPDNLNRRVETSSCFFSFIRPPFLSSSQSHIYLRIRAEDKDGYSSDFSEVITGDFK